MIGLLARRTLTDRPRRSLLLLAGFGISVGVMIVLLSIGTAVLDQARNPMLVGGDLVVLPEGVDVEAMKLGGATGMFFAVDNARFVFRKVLSGPRFAPDLLRVPAPAWPGESAPPPLAAASPSLAGKLVYVRRAGSTLAPRRALASGVIPSLDRAVTGALHDARGNEVVWSDTDADRMWMEPPVDSLYNDIDRFHIPPAGQQDLERWSEWLYFNFTEPSQGVVGFLSLTAAGDIAAGRGRAIPLLQLVWPGEAPHRFPADMPLARSDISTERVDLRLGSGTRARFTDGAWRLQIGWQSPNGPVRGELRVEPVRDLDFPPFLIHESERFVSGYVVPAIRAHATGWIEAGGRRVELRDAPAYHDHNWGTWRNVHWDWGTAGSDAYGLFYGRVEHPELHPGRSGAGVFCMLAQARQPEVRGGFLGLFRPDSIAYAWDTTTLPLPGNPRRVPRAIGFATQPAMPGDATDRIDVRIDVDRVLASSPWPGDDRVFLQAHGDYAVEATIAGQPVRMRGPGFAEVFVPAGH
jgi:hypothetical protein